MTTDTSHSTDVLLQMQDIAFSYKADVPIFSGLNMTFKRGHVSAIMGGSGCGKTSLLRLIGGLVLPDRGTIRYEGEIIDTSNQKNLYRFRRKLGMLFQFGALFTDMSVFENVAFPLREHTALPEDQIQALVDEKLDAVGLSNTGKLFPAQISGGMARRVALARTIILDPELVMYDEPFAGLDPITASNAANLIRALNDARGTTSILVSHDISETFAIADYIYFVGQGKVLAEGTPTELQDCDNPLVRQFIDAKPNRHVTSKASPSFPPKTLAGDAS